MRRRGLLGNLGEIEDPAAISKGCQGSRSLCTRPLPTLPQLVLGCRYGLVWEWGRSRVFPPRVLGMLDYVK